MTSLDGGSESPYSIKPVRVYTLSEPEAFAFQSTKDESQPILVVERKEAGFGKFMHKSLYDLKPMLKNILNVQECWGVIGVVKVPSGTFLLVISDAKAVANINGTEIYCVNDVHFLPFMNNEYWTFMDPVEKQNIEKSYYDLRKWISGSFYFSFGLDVTHKLQTADINVENKKQGEPLYLSAHKKFWWNRYACSFFTKNKLHPWITVLMKGFVQMAQSRVFGHKVELTVISRLSCLRAGTRFNARGVNDDGNVGNFVETEQVVVCEGKLTSFVQIRGSVPLFWEQKMTRGVHRTALSRGVEATAPAFRKHFEALSKQYGPQYIINLLHVGKESEKVIIDAFEDQLRAFNSNELKYVAFDFHKQLGTSGLQFQRIGPMLLDGIQADLLKYGLYAKDAEGQVLLSQRGVFRTNCLDCLDRTNVCQGSIAKRALQFSLQVLEVATGSQVENLASTPLEEIHSQMWANNGDALSIAYTGTGAMKSSITRTGKLTLGGLLDDASKSVMRTYQNNFKDSNKQDVIDLFLGNQAAMDDVDQEEDQLMKKLKARESEFMEISNLTVFVGTWNVGCAEPGEDLFGWLGNINPCPAPPDVYVIGFQEVVELTGKAVWNADQTNAQNWQRQILETISVNNKFVILRSYQLVGILLTLFVREDQINNYRDVHSEIAKVGFRGIAGNKGAITIRFKYHASTFAFTCAHLAAGQSNIEERNKDYADIIANTQVRTQNGVQGILNHDFVFFFGDLNYRINLDYNEVKRLIAAKDYDELYEFDQLQLEKAKGGIFKGFHEAPITFPPTYKYDFGTDIYDTSEKRRTPAWCDRILFRANTIKQFNYKVGALNSSDHKPVSSVFASKVKMVNKEKQKKVLDELAREITDSSLKSAVEEALLIDIEGVAQSLGSPLPQPHQIPNPFGQSTSDPLPRKLSIEKQNAGPPLPPKDIIGLDDLHIHPQAHHHAPPVPPKPHSSDHAVMRASTGSAPPVPAKLHHPFLDDTMLGRDTIMFNNAVQAPMQPSVMAPMQTNQGFYNQQQPMMQNTNQPNLYSNPFSPPQHVQQQTYAPSGQYQPQPNQFHQQPNQFQQPQNNPQADPFAIFTSSPTITPASANTGTLQPPPPANRSRKPSVNSRPPQESSNPFLEL